MKKLRNNRGETLIEMLVSILIAALSVTLLFGCIMASSNIDKAARSLDEKHYNALSEAEARPTPPASPVPTGNVTITLVSPSADPQPNAAPPIEIYGGEGMFSYKRSGS